MNSSSNNFHFEQDILSTIQAANTTDSSLLITGETGTGKTYLAKLVHEASPRNISGRWCKINLATLSENLIESELFGHEKGAFTGADAKRMGRLEFCNGGTVFLDEIGELSIRLQAKLLDFIQFKKITPVGANREIELDVKIVAATNKNLEDCVKRGEFRADLYHRLNVFHITLPRLRDQHKEIERLAHLFLKTFNAKTEKKIIGIDDSFLQTLLCHEWPGNIRELENVICFAVAKEKSQFLTVDSLPPYLSSVKNSLPLKMNDTNPKTNFILLPRGLKFHESKDLFEKSYIEEALRVCRGQINLTSRETGLNKVSLIEKIKRYNIDWKDIRSQNLGPFLKEEHLTS
ncbi:MAG: sigma 54-interacting transcriptional regulator [Bacteriovoracia bacterium]